MNRLERAPGGAGLPAWTAGRQKERAKPFPRRGVYHEGRRAGRSVKVYVHTAFGPKVAGVLVTEAGRTVFRRLVQGDRHMVRVPESAWAFDAEVLERVSAAGATEVEVIDQDGRRWWTSLSYLLERGEPLDRGHGRQIALPLRLWSFLPADSAARQLRLLEVGT